MKLFHGINREAWQHVRAEGLRMILSNIVRKKSGLSQQSLSRLVKLRLIPKPTRIASGRGSAFIYPDTIFTRLHMIEFLRGHGLTLTQIAQAAEGTPFECVDLEPSDRYGLPPWT